MLNFRYHVVSLVAVFLALSIGVIMGSTVIDQTLVDRLETQQQQLRVEIEEVEEANGALQGRVETAAAYQAQLNGESGERLVDGALDGVPVLAMGVRGGDLEALDDLLTVVDAAGADLGGQLWLTERLTLDEDADRTELAGVLEERASLSAEVLRDIAIRRVADELRSAAVDAEPAEPGGAPEPEPEPGPTTVIDALLAAGFLEYVAPEGVDADRPEVGPGTRVLLGAGDDIEGGGSELVVGLAEALVDPGRASPTLPVIAVASSEAADDGVRPEAEVVEGLRAQAPLSERLSTVDNIDQLVGRVAAVLALQDIGDGGTGHFGLGEGAASLLPPPVPDGDGG